MNHIINWALTCLHLLTLSCLICFGVSPAQAAEDTLRDYHWVKNGFENFLRCETADSIQKAYFGGVPFEITHIVLYEAHNEGDLLIASGFIECNLKDRIKRVYVVVGVKEILDRLRVYFFHTQETQFTLLASQLSVHPYLGTCPWVQFSLE